MPTLYQCSEEVILPSGEQALFSLWVIDGGTDSPLSTGVGFMDAFHSTLSADATFTALYDSATIFSGYRVSLVNIATGVIESAAVGGSPFGGTHSLGTPLPPQVAVAVTVRTALAGRSDRGRFYLPPPVTVEVGSTGRLGGSTALTIVTAIGTAVDTAMAALSDGALVVYSRVHHDYTEAVRLEVGDVFDTQRRRRDKLVEARQNYTLA